MAAVRAWNMFPPVCQQCILPSDVGTIGYWYLVTSNILDLMCVVQAGYKRVIHHGYIWMTALKAVPVYQGYSASRITMWYLVLRFHAAVS